MKFRNRTDAGKALGRALKSYEGKVGVTVLALPRGGVPVGFVVARALGLPLEVFIVRKLGTPGQEELALGAIASGGVRVLNRELVETLGISAREIDALVQREEKEVARRERAYRGERQPLGISGQTVIIVDDGIATGATMRAAISAARKQGATKVVVATPVASQTTVNQLADEADEIVCLYAPEHFYAVGEWYEDFAPTTDEEVRRLIEEASPPAS